MSPGSLDKRIPSGFAWLSRSLLGYAASASLTSLGAFLFVAASNAYSTQDSSRDALNIDGFIAAYSGLVLASVALAFLALGFRDLRMGIARFDPGAASTILASRNLLFGAYFAATLAGLMFPVSFYSRSPGQLSASLAILLLFTTTAAFLFLAAVGLPLLRFTRDRRQSMAWLAFALGACGVGGESATSVLSLVTSMSGPTSWIVYGGWPLLNLSVLFGPVVAISAFVMSILYRHLGQVWTYGATEREPAPPRSPTGPII